MADMFLVPGRSFIGMDLKEQDRNKLKEILVENFLNEFLKYKYELFSNV